MSSPTKHRASDTRSGRSRNDESTRGRKVSDAARGAATAGKQAGGGKKAPSALSKRRG
jgi:hypothetical protein